jgi:hypothetical protein
MTTSQPPSHQPSNQPGQAQAGVCIVTVERQPHLLLITVRTNRNLDRHLYSARPEKVERFADPELAIEATASFLRTFARE